MYDISGYVTFKINSWNTCMDNGYTHSSNFNFEHIMKLLINDSFLLTE